MEQREGSFFDPKTIIAIVLVGVVWFAWQSYLTKKYPDYGKPNVAAQGTPAPEVSTTELPNTGSAKTTDAVPIVSSKTGGPEKFLGFENEVFSMQISSKGMGLKQLILKKFKNREHLPVQLGQSELAGLFELRVNGVSVDFDLSPVQTEGGFSTFTGTAKVDGVNLKRSLTFGNSYFVRSEVTVEGAPAGYGGFQILIPEIANTAGPGTIFSPPTETQEFVHGTGKTFERIGSYGTESIQKTAGLFEIFGISSHYFITAFANQSPLLPEVALYAKPGDKEILTSATYRPTTTTPLMMFASTLFAGPKDVDTLHLASTAQLDLTPLVSFGFFEMIGKILLKILQFFYNYTIPNWGVAIILLTILVRILVLPFNLASYKSMKKMQVIQPQIAELRERYKEDPTTLNTQMMKLMKDQKVNPLGGCLPMLLQMPVFFALYQVLGQSIDLYQAPFFGWIQDLSLKDPYFVLPILMGVSMWYNQKITPTTMDPTQAKIMQFLPLVFSLMMFALPSGLTLYIFISTVFGIIQQQIFMKDRSKQAQAV
jgi:YidC/Oxa1 family membrane protein insertase